MIMNEVKQIFASESVDKADLDKLEAMLLNNSLKNEPLKLVGAEGDEVNLPEIVSQALRELVDYLSQGQAVSLVPTEKEITTQEAADLLNTSRPYLVKLLEQGEIPYRKVGKHRRLRLAEVIDYKQKREVERRNLLDEITSLSQEMGLYDVPAKPQDAI